MFGHDELRQAGTRNGAFRLLNLFLYLWAYAPGAFEEMRAVVYDFCESRAGEHARAFLGDWRGSLICDDYAGYKASFSQGVTEAGSPGWASRTNPFGPASCGPFFLLRGMAHSGRSGRPALPLNPAASALLRSAPAAGIGVATKPLTCRHPLLV